MKNARGITLVELLIAIAAIAVIAFAVWAGLEQDENAERTACLGTQKDVIQFQQVWMATVAENPPHGDKILCSSYRTAADAWNQQCSEHFDAFPLPEKCV